MAAEGEQWIENCFMLRFLICPGLRDDSAGNRVIAAPFEDFALSSETLDSRRIELIRDISNNQFVHFTNIFIV